ncbi:hypothetical protein [Nonomuraea sp. NEAU-A123]|uniref:hypothetical protein n=1 Tax=Nonomuraea sp. NEAU-A123 TaxID=2839649 RepID=UPI001BE494CA|nr:hypothetical protein [Nonomuraea sp. NEAU-A123]MBT2233146.1 hypothetical protein [Nonomuraea sp. NEAU-A123]
MIRRRSVRTALTQLLRQWQGTGSELSSEDFDERRAALERAGDDWTGPVDSDLAFSTLAGRTPWQNGMAALLVGTLLSLPLSAVRIIEAAGSWQSGGLEFVLALSPLLTLPALCMIFGYFYPRVRGANPIAKSLVLLVAALLIELPTYVRTLVVASTQGPSLSDMPPPTPREALISVLVAVGDIAVVSLGLGLWWEWRLMSLAGEPWVRIRNIRTLRALAAPLAAIAIAIGTTAATALVNNVIAPLPTVQAPPEKSPSATP